MSILAWIVFIICAVAVFMHYSATGDRVFLLYAIPSLAFLIIIPLTLAWMSRRSFARASIEHSARARKLKIGKIDLRQVGTVLKVQGDVQKISFQWLNRPHFHVKDETAAIRVVMFTAPANRVKVGDRVEVLGIVMKNLFARKTPIISAVSVQKIEDT